MTRLAAILVAAMIVGPVWAGFDEGNAAFNAGNYATAAREFLPLAEQGHIEAQTLLGWMYKLGSGVPQDYAEAVRWLRPAAEQGASLAMVEFGTMLANGQGVSRNNVLAYMWLNLAVSLVQPTSDGLARVREIAKRARDQVARRMTSAQIAEAQRLAREWCAKHGKK